MQSKFETDYYIRDPTPSYNTTETISVGEHAHALINNDLSLYTTFPEIESSDNKNIIVQSNNIPNVKKRIVKPYIPPPVKVKFNRTAVYPRSMWIRGSFIIARDKKIFINGKVEIIKEYALINTPHELYLFIKQTPPEERIFYECISYNMPHKFCMDIDCKLYDCRISI